jgi:uncharacterized phage-associated protein
MASVHDVAQYILEEKGELDTWKLQKLVYYSQAWHLVWEGAPLFPQHIEAWANGPVSPHLYKVHRGLYRVTRWRYGSAERLGESQRESINVVLKHYGRATGFSLRQLTHSEAPWKNARKGLPPGAPSNNIITTDAMAAYYGSL